MNWLSKMGLIQYQQLGGGAEQKTSEPYKKRAKPDPNAKANATAEEALSPTHERRDFSNICSFLGVNKLKIFLLGRRRSTAG